MKAAGETWAREGYRWVRKLGEGGQAQVHLWEEEATGARFAAKVFKGFAADMEGRKIMEESRIICSVCHPCVVHGCDLLMPKVAGEPTVILMEYCDGGTFDAKKSTPTEMNYVAVSLAKAILYLHSLEIVHQDIKPSNLLWGLVGKQRVPKLTDFGSSRFYDWALSQVRVPVSYCYSAPELLDGDPSPGFAADVYSFGIILFELVTQAPVFPVNTPLLRLADVIKKDIRPEIPRSVDPVVRGVIEDCWKADPARRPAFIDVCERLAAQDWLVVPGADEKKVANFLLQLPPDASSSKSLLVAYAVGLGGRVEALEARLAASEAAHRAEMAALRAEMSAALARPAGVAATPVGPKKVFDGESCAAEFSGVIDEFLGDLLRGPLKLVWRFSDTQTLHPACLRALDGVANTLIIFQAKNALFGGFAVPAWHLPSSETGYDDQTGRSFVFVLRSPGCEKPIKMPLKRGAHALCCRADGGFEFYDTVGLCTRGYVWPFEKWSYVAPEGGSEDLFGGRGEWEVAGLEAWQVA